MGYAMNQSSSKSAHSQTESASIEQITLDCDHILTHAGGDPELLIQLCGAFLNELPVRMESLHSALKDRNSPGVQRAVQQLRNCLIIFGSTPLSLTAEMLEAAVRSGRKRQMQRECKRLKRQVQILVPQVQRLMLEMSTPRSAVQ
jgi:HPt (histidine-containing phosphotransfer) domain-containing protein